VGVVSAVLCCADASALGVSPAPNAGHPLNVIINRPVAAHIVLVLGLVIGIPFNQWDNHNRDFPFDFLPTASVGHFLDFVPSPRNCKPLGQSAFRFSLAKGVIASREL